MTSWSRESYLRLNFCLRLCSWVNTWGVLLTRLGGFMRDIGAMSDGLRYEGRSPLGGPVENFCDAAVAAVSLFNLRE